MWRALILLLLSSAANANSHIDVAIHCIPRGGENNNGTAVKRRRRRRLFVIHKQIINGARTLLGQTTNALFRRGINNSNVIKSRQGYTNGDIIIQEDHTFDDLDNIINEGSVSSSIDDNHSHHYDDDDDDDDFFTSTTKPPREAATLKGWKRRSLRAWVRKMEQQFLSKETARRIKTIKRILVSFPDYGVVDLFGLYSPKEVVLSIVALSRLQHVLETRNNMSDNDDDDKDTLEKKKNETAIDNDILDELAHYCVFANVAYGWIPGVAFCGRFHFGNERALIRRTNIHQRDILMTHWHSRRNRPAFFLVRDRTRNVLVLSIRGTLSPRDVLTDLCASCENFLVEDNPDDVLSIDNDEEPSITDSESSVLGDIDESIRCDWGQVQFSRAHSGMVDAAKCVARITAKIISEELHSDPTLSLVIVGHSLGGGIAAVLATMWKQRFVNRVRSIGFGNPCVFPLASSADCDNIISVTGEGDPFACISLGHLANLSRALSKLCCDSGFREEIMQHTSSETMSEEDYAWCITAMTFLRKQMNSEILVPPGVIYVMSGSLFDFPNTDNNGESVLRCNIRAVDPAVFNELRISPRMFDLTRHVPARYEAVLQRIAASSSVKSD
jgi:hypothetical protein